MVSKGFILLTLLLVFANPVAAQAAATASALPIVTLQQLTQRDDWPRIDFPPPDAYQLSEADRDRGRATLTEVLGAARASWAGEPPETPTELRGRIGEYEKLINVALSAGGYGNLVIADCLRRLSLALLTDYLLSYPSEPQTVGQILNGQRVRLSNDSTLYDLLREDLKSPQREWRFAESRADLENVLRADGSSAKERFGTLLLRHASVSDLTRRRSIGGLLARLVEDDAEETVVLAGFVDFLSLGGRFGDLRLDNVGPFLSIMQSERLKFRFPSLGINMLRVEHLDSMLRHFQSPNGSHAPFDTVIGR